MGDPELEVHATAKQSTQGAAVDVQCSGEHAAEYSVQQPGMRDQAFVYDQNGNFWGGDGSSVLLMTPQQIDLAVQSESRGFNITMWEDDDTPCVIKQRGSGDFLKQALRAVAEATGGYAALYVGLGWKFAWGFFGAAATDLFNLLTGDDDFVGDLIAKDVTIWSQEYPDNNFIIMDHNNFAGRATLVLNTSTPSGSPVSSVLVTPNTPDLLPPGGAVQMDARGYDSQGRYATESSRTWSSSNPSVASVSSDGVLTAVAEGSATITATVNGVSGSTTATVYGPASYLSIDPQSSTIYVDNGAWLRAQAYDSHGTPVTGGGMATWASSNESVATVDYQGLVTGIREGSVVISATYNGATGVAGVMVQPVPTCGGGVACNIIVAPPSAPANAAGSRAKATAPRSAAGARKTGR